MDNIEKINVDSDIKGHIQILKKYAGLCKHITEMGVRKVQSTWVFLDSKPDKLVSIDWDKPPFEVDRNALKEVEEQALKQKTEFQFVSGNTLDLYIEQTDMLYIDTWHTYEQLLCELMEHSNNVKKYIVCHDTNEKIFPGMTCAIEDFLDLNPQWNMDFMLVDFPGITVLNRIDDLEVNWGDFKRDNLIDEIDIQVSLYFENCTEENGPKSLAWLSYCNSQVNRFSNSVRWPKSNMTKGS